MNLGFAVLEQLDYLILASAKYHPSIHPISPLIQFRVTVDL